MAHHPGSPRSLPPLADRSDVEARIRRLETLAGRVRRLERSFETGELATLPSDRLELERRLRALEIRAGVRRGR